MPVDMYMQVEGVSGESKDANHHGWTDILSYTWGANQPGTMATGGGGGIGKVSFDDLQVVANADKATPAILKFCANGKHIPQVQLSICKAGGSQVEYKRITLTDVLVSALQQSASQTSDAVQITYRFQAAKVKQQYWEQTDQGGKGGESVLTWNIKENREM